MRHRVINYLHTSNALLVLLVCSAMSQTVTEIAEEFWKTNSCEYPPQDFYGLFEDTCTVKAQKDSFITGMCEAYYNSSKTLCHLDGVGVVDKEKFIGITSAQPSVGDIEVCDSLSSLRHKDPNLFPKPIGDDAWFESTYDIIFSDLCATACGFHHLHPLCYGFFLNYEYFEKQRVLDALAAEKVEPAVPVAPASTAANAAGSQAQPKTPKTKGSSSAFGIALTLSILFLVFAGVVLLGAKRRGLIRQLWSYKGF